MQVRRELRSADDGYRDELVPGLRSSEDALLLAREVGFAAGRLLALASEPPGLYGEVRDRAGIDVEQATWTAFLIALLSPLEEDEPFAGIRAALALWPAPVEPSSGGEDLRAGPRGAHEPQRLVETVCAYVQWVCRSAAGETSQASALRGDESWTPERRFGRLFERLALPGFGRAARYELLVLLGRLGRYELRPDGLHLGDRRGEEDLATQGAKRVFGIADPILLERRARALAEASEVPLEALDLALANWAERRRVTLGFRDEVADASARGRTEAALGL